MEEYVLIIFMYAGFISKSDSVAINNVSGFANKELCVEAGKQSVKEFTNFGFKSGKYVCVRVK